MTDIGIIIVVVVVILLLIAACPRRAVIETEHPSADYNKSTRKDK